MHTGKQHQSDIYISIFYPPSSTVMSNVPKHLFTQKHSTKCSVTNQLTLNEKIFRSEYHHGREQANNVLMQVAIRTVGSTCQPFL